MHHFRGCVATRRQHRDQPWYSRPERPMMRLAGGSVSSPSSPGSFGRSTTLKSSCDAMAPVGARLTLAGAPSRTSTLDAKAPLSRSVGCQLCFQYKFVITQWPLGILQCIPTTNLAPRCRSGRCVAHLAICPSADCTAPPHAHPTATPPRLSPNFPRFASDCVACLGCRPTHGRPRHHVSYDYRVYPCSVYSGSVQCDADRSDSNT